MNIELDVGTLLCVLSVLHFCLCFTDTYLHFVTVFLGYHKKKKKRVRRRKFVIRELEQFITDTLI